MRSDVIVIARVRLQNLAQMHLAQDNDVVHTLTPDRSDQPFGKAVLPGRGWRGWLVPDAHGAQSACDDAAIDPIPIADEVMRRFIPRTCLRYLTRNPVRRRICCDVDPDQVSAVQPDDDEGIEQVETDSWNNEQVHGGNVWRVVMQEGSLKPQLRLEWRGQDGQNETEQLDHSASLGDSITSSTRIRFSVHQQGQSSAIPPAVYRL